MAARIFETSTSAYTELQIIGEGGAGTVYRVSDEDGAEFALKLLRETSSAKRKRFKNELSFCRQNQHARIVKVLDDGLFRKGKARQPFFVMPLYDTTLRKFMDAERPTKDALKLFGDILDGVEAAHLNGVFHRDLKPENLLIGMPDQRAVVADFGIAHFEEEFLLTLVETHGKEKIGNFAYAAPEQRARGRHVDHRSDIFSLGLILNEMFTGEVPQGSGYRLIADVDRSFSYLDPIVERMIRQDPMQRPSSVGAVKDQLITAGAEYIARQKLEAATGAVIPEAAPEDPLGGRDVSAMGFKFEDGALIFQFEPAPPPMWMVALRSLTTYTSFGTAEPSRVQSLINGRAYIQCRAQDAELVARSVKQWTAGANRDYRATLANQAAELRRQDMINRAAARRRLEEEAAAMERLKNAGLT